MQFVNYMREHLGGRSRWGTSALPLSMTSLTASRETPRASEMLRTLAPFLRSSRMAVRWLWSSISQLLVEQLEEAVGVGVGVSGAASEFVSLGR